MQDWDVPGLAVAVVKDGETVWTQGFGVRDVRTGGSVDENTLFAIGSASKAFTSLAVATLVDEGALEWDDRVTDHLPGFRTSEPYVTRELTLRDILSHRSGLNRGDQVWYAMDIDPDEILKRLRYQPPTTSFRSAFGYNNNMFLAAGQIVQALTGRTWDEVVDGRFFTPLGMTRSVTSVRSIDGVENVASPHWEIDDEVQVVPWRDIDNIGPAGSIISSVAEMDEWLKLHLAGGSYGGVEIVGEATLGETHRPHTIIPLQPPWSLMAPEAHFLTYGMGWFLSDYRGRKAVAHGGNIDGMSALVGMLPEEGLGVVILTNMNGTFLPYALMHRVFDHYLGAPEGGMRDWSEEMAASFAELEAAAEAQAEETREARAEGTSPSLALEAYAGTYRHPMFGDLTLSLEGGGLVARRDSAWVGDLEHWHYDTFRIDWRDATMGEQLMTVRLDAMGEPVAVELQGSEGVFERVDEAGGG
jgi:CubicO group peptidase (beta-lactamase class C family)